MLATAMIGIFLYIWAMRTWTAHLPVIQLLEPQFWQDPSGLTWKLLYSDSKEYRTLIEAHTINLNLLFLEVEDLPLPIKAQFHKWSRLTPSWCVETFESEVKTLWHPGLTTMQWGANNLLILIQSENELFPFDILFHCAMKGISRHKKVSRNKVLQCNFISS